MEFNAIRPINEVLHSLLLIGKPRIKYISKKEPPGLMNKNSYEAAHKFVNGLKSITDIIKYRSVRDATIDNATYEIGPIFYLIGWGGNGRPNLLKSLDHEFRFRQVRQSIQPYFIRHSLFGG